MTPRDEAGEREQEGGRRPGARAEGEHKATASAAVMLAPDRKLAHADSATSPHRRASARPAGRIAGQREVTGHDHLVEEEEDVARGQPEEAEAAPQQEPRPAPRPARGRSAAAPMLVPPQRPSTAPSTQSSLRRRNAAANVRIVSLRPRRAATAGPAPSGQVEPPSAGPRAPAQSAGPYRGMFPCLRRGRGSRFVSAVSSAEISTGRVRRGSMTSSTYPRSAAT